MAFTTNPYVTYHEGNSKEFIQLNKVTMTEFKAYEKFDLTPSNTYAFSECMDRTSKIYAYYGYLCQFPITMNIVPDGTVTLGDHANLIETWNRIGLNTVLNYAHMTRGDK